MWLYDILLKCKMPKCGQTEDIMGFIDKLLGNTSEAQIKS